jgi:predicted 2-oxoglutarate/Fe(II)-dependent dioxygenase YbiX
MSSLTTELAEMLSTVQRPGDYYTTGTTEIFAPHLEVAGVGPIALPLLPVQAQQLIAVAERAPYGRGEETLVDTEVRRTWQIDPERVQIAGRHWARTLADIVARAAAGLGVTGPVVAELYKLLVYDTGSFFVSHRDTEKAAGMFATLIIVLPSIYTGGELLVRHRDREVRLDLCCSEPSEVAFAAFYADCVHEVLPITSGCRLTLIYNLRRQGRGRLPEPPNYDTEQTSVTALLRQWIAGKEAPDDDSPEKLIYPLEHAYTTAELSFEALKGADAAVAAVLVAAAPPADCDLHLALVSIEESGSAEHSGYDGSRRRRWSDEEDEDDFEVGEVYDRRETLSDWRSPDGSRPELGDFPFKAEELCPPDAFEDLDPDEQHFHEATGNEGASFERTYRRAALVLWPRERRLVVLNQAGQAVTLPYLGELTRRWADSGEGPESPLWREAHELSGHMLRTWPRQVGWYPGSTAAHSDAATMLTLLSRLQDTARIDAFLAGLAAGVYGKGDNEAMVRAAGLLPPERAAALIERIIAGHAAANFSACGDLLARSVAARVTGRPADLCRAATALVEALPGDPAHAPQRDPWRQLLPVEPGFLVDLLTALGQIHAALADRAADHILAWPQTYGLDSVLVPAVLSLTGQAASRDVAAVQRLRTAGLEHLRARIAEPLEPPRDWARASDIACRCSHCSELSRFLADPDRQSWIFKAAETARRHVEDSIRRSGCDLNRATDRRGRPYSLVCTKNQASYDRRAQQRQQDLAHLARLEAPPDRVCRREGE